MTLNLASLPLSPAGHELGLPADAWLRATLVIAGTVHYLDLVWVTIDRFGIQRTASRELDTMLRYHHLAAGAEKPFETVTFRSETYVLFLTPAAL